MKGALITVLFYIFTMNIANDYVQNSQTFCVGHFLKNFLDRPYFLKTVSLDNSSQKSLKGRVNRFIPAF